MTSFAKLGPDSTASGLAGRVSASTSDMRRCVRCSKPLVRLTSTASDDMCGANSSITERMAWEGTAMATVSAQAATSEMSAVASRASDRGRPGK